MGTCGSWSSASLFPGASKEPRAPWTAASAFLSSRSRAPPARTVFCCSFLSCAPTFQPSPPLGDVVPEQRTPVIVTCRHWGGRLPNKPRDSSWGILPAGSSPPGATTALSLWRLPCLPLQVQRTEVSPQVTAAPPRVSRRLGGDWGAAPGLSPWVCPRSLPWVVWMPSLSGERRSPAGYGGSPLVLCAVPAWSSRVVGAQSVFFTWVNPVQTLSFTGRGALLLRVEDWGGWELWPCPIGGPWRLGSSSPAVGSSWFWPAGGSALTHVRCFCGTELGHLLTAVIEWDNVLARVGRAHDFIPSGFKAHASTRPS